MAGEGHKRTRPGRRPPRAEVDPAALRLLQAHGAKVLAIARRYAASPEDAEDAFQRGLEILLTKAPTTNEAELLAWLKTVVKHEAFAVRRQRERATPTADDGALPERVGFAAAAHEQAERYERLRHGAEALGRLKPQEIRTLLLRAEGYSYAEICEITGWTYTKVNRCLTEGRNALARRVAGIESGSECERMAPLLSALVDGEASADELGVLRPHLRSCLACRTRMREFRAGPARMAAMVPAVAVASPGSPLRSWLESATGLLQHKVALLGERAHAATELAAGQKVAAVAASAAAMAGGGTAAERAARERPASDERRQVRPASAARPSPQPAGSRAAPSAPVRTAPQVRSPTPGGQEPSPPAATPPRPPPPESEFAPVAQPAPASRPREAGAAPEGAEFAP